MSRMYRWLLVCLLLAMPGTARAEERFALLIGNETYNPGGRFARLPSVPGDIQTIRSALTRAGFAERNIQVVPNAGAAQMRLEVRRFAQRLRAAGADGVGFFYFAGHGVQIDGVNFLIPSDVAIGSRDTARLNGVAASDLQAEIEASQNRLNLLILDACRNDPFDRSGAGAGGLAPMSATARGSIIAFSTAARKTAEDGLYARHLARAITTPGLRVDDALRRARASVQAERPDQVPTFEDNLQGDWYFIPPDGSTNPPTAGRPVAPPAPTSPSPPPPRPVAAGGYPVSVGQSFRDCAECPEMVVIPGGSFQMGSPASEQGRQPNEGPQRTVRLGSPLAVGRHPVTVGEYRTFVAATGRSDGQSCLVWTSAGKWEQQSGRTWRSTGFSQSDRHPVVCVSWEDTQAYVRWLSSRSGQRYRLLTEAEWEYAARAGTRTAGWWGEAESDQCRYANLADISARAQVPGASHWPIAPCDDGFAYTSPAGQFQANRFGLFDMGGNVWQRVGDCYLDSYAGAPLDASVAVAHAVCNARMARGGSWYSGSYGLRAAVRSHRYPDDRESDLGFRVARTPGG